MIKQNSSWKLQSLTFDKELNEALQQQHHAAQFVALVGRHLIPQQPDDSNTNMEFIADKDMLLGNAIPIGLKVALKLSSLEILILDKNNITKKVIILDGKSQHSVFEELKQGLSDLGVDVTSFKNELHYEIPVHQLDDGGLFSVENENGFVENANYRHNAKIALNEIATLFEQKEHIRIWPHHFDTGAFFSISKNDKRESTQTIGIGLAIPDSMVNEPYYYLSFWSNVSDEKVTTLPALITGKWITPNWNGAILKISEIQKQKSAVKQFELVHTFFTQGIEILMNYLKNLKDEKT